MSLRAVSSLVLAERLLPYLTSNTMSLHGLQEKHIRLTKALEGVIEENKDLKQQLAAKAALEDEHKKIQGKAGAGVRQESCDTCARNQLKRKQMEQELKELKHQLEESKQQTEDLQGKLNRERSENASLEEEKHKLSDELSAEMSRVNEERRWVGTFCSCWHL